MGIKEQISDFVVDNFLFGERNGLKDDTSFLEAGIVDSTGILELVAFLEREFSISIEDHELIPDNLDSIEKTTAFLERRGINTVGAEEPACVNYIALPAGLRD